MFVWMELTEYLQNVNMYLFGLPEPLIWFNYHFFLLSQYLFNVSKYQIRLQQFKQIFVKIYYVSLSM